MLSTEVIIQYKSPKDQNNKIANPPPTSSNTSFKIFEQEIGLTLPPQQLNQTLITNY